MNNLSLSRYILLITLFSTISAGNSIDFFGDCYEKKLIERLNSYTRSRIPAPIIEELGKLVADNTPYKQPVSQRIPSLFKVYTALTQSIPYISFCDLPTPILKCAQFGSLIGVPQFYVKDDGQTGPLTGTERLFGGNKPRKLEFLLADALAHGARTVLTFGCTGSNHALATTVYAKKLGMNSICMLADQPNAHTVRRNLLLQSYYGAKIRHSPSGPLFYVATADECLLHKRETGAFPYIIPIGGSNALGMVGFVNAAFELKEQIAQGLMPEPDIIFVAMGYPSGGTSTGLLLGLKAAGLKSHLVVVGVEPEDEPNQMANYVRKQFAEVNTLLHQADPTFPLFKFPENQFSFVAGFGGKDYGLFTPEAMTAKKMLFESEQIKLDGTYTGKACAGMLDYITKNQAHGSVILFWNSFFADECTSLLARTDYKKLPKSLHKYFEEDVQPLDHN